MFDVVMAPVVTRYVGEVVFYIELGQFKVTQLKEAFQLALLILFQLWVVLVVELVETVKT